MAAIDEAGASRPGQPLEPDTTGWRGKRQPLPLTHRLQQQLPVEREHRAGLAFLKEDDVAVEFGDLVQPGADGTGPAVPGGDPQHLVTQMVVPSSPSTFDLLPAIEPCHAPSQISAFGVPLVERQ